MILLGSVLIITICLVMAWGMGRQDDSTDWEASTEERAAAASEVEKWGALGKMALVLLLFLIVAGVYLGAIGASLMGMAR